MKQEYKTTHNTYIDEADNDNGGYGDGQHVTRITGNSVNTDIRTI